MADPTVVAGPLPAVDRKNALQRLSLAALNSALPADRLVFRDERVEDYGVDGTLEVLSGGAATNFRAHLQLKATESTPTNTDASISIQVATSNLNYLLNGSSPLYVLYDHATGALFYAWARDEQERLARENPDWLQQQTVTLRFRERLTPEAFSHIHARVQQEGRRQRTNSDGPEVLVRHLICRESILNEVLDRRLSSLNTGRILLVENEVFGFARRVRRRKEAQAGPSWDSYPDFESFRAAHRDARLVEIGGDTSLPIFATERSATFEELGASADPLITLCLEERVPSKELGLHLGRMEHCGDTSFIEALHTRRVALAFTAITNVGTSSVQLQELTVLHEATSGASYRPLEACVRERDPQLVALPKAAIAPHETVLIPEFLLMLPLQFSNRVLERVWEDGQHEVTRVLSKESWSTGRNAIFHVVGPSLVPRSLRFIRADGTSREVAVHPFDLHNLYTLGQEWMVGSCPHLFWRSAASGKWRYLGEILSSAEGAAISATDVVLPAEAGELRLSELEYETTELHRVHLVDGEGGIALLTEPCVLRRGDSRAWHLPQRLDQRVVRFTGRYVPDRQLRETTFAALMMRCEWVAQHLHCLEESGASSASTVCSP